MNEYYYKRYVRIAYISLVISIIALGLSILKLIQ